MAARVHRINVNPDGGVPKHRVASTRLLHGGVEGDQQRDLRYHGGPKRAVCLYSLERLKALAEEGHPAGPGSLGENLTIEGLEWGAVRRGMRFEIGARLPAFRNIRKTQAVVLASGVLLIELVGLIPIVGGITQAAIAFLALGAVIRSRFGTRQLGPPVSL